MLNSWLLKLERFKPWNFVLLKIHKQNIAFLEKIYKLLIYKDVSLHPKLEVQLNFFYPFKNYKFWVSSLKNSHKNSKNWGF